MSSARRSLILLAAIGCSHDAGEPSGYTLYGQWGSSGEAPAQLIGLGVAAELQLACSSVGTHKPVVLGSDSTFGFTGTLRTSVAESPEPRARVQGHWEGDVVNLDFDILDDGLPGWSYTLERGVDPRFQDQPPSCPLAN